MPRRRSPLKCDSLIPIIGASTQLAQLYCNSDVYENNSKYCAVIKK
jgi:hypothetical protein